MYSSSQVEILNEQFKKEQLGRRKQLKKIWFFFLGLTIIICLILYLIFPNQFFDGSTAWIMPVYGGLAFLTTLIGYLISHNYNSEKPFFNYLYKEMYQKINLDQGLYLEYESYNKTEKTFNKEDGLFTSFANVNIRRFVKGYTLEQYTYKTYDCELTTSSGNNRQVHFNGIYFSIEKPLNTTIQIRSNGSPKIKGVKLSRLPEFTEFKVYKEADSSMSNLDHQLLRFASNLNQDPNIKKMYLGVYNNRLNLAVWYRKYNCRKHSKINIDVLNNAYNYFMSELDLITQLNQINNF